MKRYKKFFLKISVAAIIIAALFCATVAGARVIFPRKYLKEVTDNCALFGGDAALVFAVIKAESGFDENGVSGKGAVGLMQITPKTAEFIAKNLFGEEPQDLFDPETNIRYGVRYLAYLREKFADEKSAIAAYNAGEGNVGRWLEDKELSSDGKILIKVPFPETQSYIEKVYSFRKVYSILYNYP